MEINKTSTPKVSSDPQAILLTHTERGDSLEYQLCRLHIQLMQSQKLPRRFRIAQDKQTKGKTLNERDERQLALLAEYESRYPLPTRKEPTPFKLSLYQSKLLMALCEFIDNPLRCHKGRLAKLHHCKSVMKGLQRKQRITLVKVITSLLAHANIETGAVGRYKKQDQLMDENGHHLLQGVPHYVLRNTFSTIWHHPISKTKYFDCIKMLKMTEFLEIEACYINNEEAEVVRHELREAGAELEQIEAIPRVYSVAAYKFFTQAFFDVFKELLRQDYMLEAKASAKATCWQKKLSLFFATYCPMGNTFTTRKNKFTAHLRFAQGAVEPPELSRAALLH